ncbi:MAG: cell division protein ZapA [Bacteroidales bacterium]|nr:cell division protein ZapA [Bacteroidales bacterium]
MADESKSVSINILGRAYQIKVNEENSKEVKEAEAEIGKLVDYFKQTYAYKDDKDLLAMAVLQFAVKAIFYEKVKGKAALPKEILDKAKEIDKLLGDSSL